MMAELRIERTVGRLQRGNEDDDSSAGDQDALERFQRAHIVGDVFQDVDAEHRIESLARELRSVAFLEVARRGA